MEKVLIQLYLDRATCCGQVVLSGLALLCTAWALTALSGSYNDAQSVQPQLERMQEQLEEVVRQNEIMDAKVNYMKNTVRGLEVDVKSTKTRLETEVMLREYHEAWPRPITGSGSK